MHEFVKSRVAKCYWEHDINRATTTLNILAKHFGIELDQQVRHAALGLLAEASPRSHDAREVADGRGLDLPKSPESCMQVHLRHRMGRLQTSSRFVY